MAFAEFLLSIITILTFVYFYLKHSHAYWKRKGIPYVKPTFLIGNTKEMFTQENSYGLHLSTIYNDPEMQNEDVIGIYKLNRPALIIRNTELMKSVLIKDFNKFCNHHSRCDKNCDPLNFYNLFFLRNSHWKEIRAKLTPVFTSGKVKQMYPLMLEIADNLEQHIQKNSKPDGTYTDEVREVCACFTTDVIATLAFGVRANSLENPNAEFRRHGRGFFNFSLLQALKSMLVFFHPSLVSLLRVKFMKDDFEKFLRDTIHFIMTERVKSGTTRNDLIDILINVKNEAASETREDFLYTQDPDFLVAQASAFYMAGFETSSTTMLFALYELAKHAEIQQRLRIEINKALSAEKGKLSYEKINSLEYLSMVVDEVLRLYPVLPFLDREYIHTPGEQKYSLKPYYNYELENGIPVYIPVYAIQRDPKYWSNPNTFDPERFSPENRKFVNPMAYMPFGLGPRSCVGSRIGLLQTKMGLVHILKNHYVRPTNKTVKEIKFEPKAFLLQSNCNLHLEFINDRLYDSKMNKN